MILFLTYLIESDDKRSFDYAKRLIREEGLLCGGSSGAALLGVFDQAHKLGKNQNCVVILPDGIRNYMSKFADNHWMKENCFN
jgi:cysteine synthase